MTIDINLNDFELDIRHGISTNDLIKIDNNFYDKKEALEIAKKLLQYSIEIFDCIDSRDIKDK